MKRIYYFVIVFGIITSAFYSEINAQLYDFSLGLRIPYLGVTGKYFLTKNQNIEGMVTSFYSNGIVFTGLYEWNAPAFDVDGMKWYYGVGGHLRMWDREAGLGIDGVIGLEYIIPSIPLNVSIDWKPAFDIITDPGFYFDDLGISVRYIFK